MEHWIDINQCYMIVIIYYFYIYSFALILLNCFNMNDYILFFIFVNLFDNKIGSLIYHNDNICLLG